MFYGFNAWVVVRLHAVALGVVLACALAGCGESDGNGGAEPGEGDYGRFRLLNGMKKKKVTSLEVYRQKADSAWDRIDDDLEPAGFANLSPAFWFGGNFDDQGALLAGTYGLRVRWQTEHSDTHWHSVTWTKDHPAFNGNPKAIMYVMLDVHPGRRGAGTVSLLMGSMNRLLQAHSEGLGRVQILNESGLDLDKFELWTKVGGSWINAHDQLVDDGLTLAAATPNGTYCTGHASPHVEDDDPVDAFYEPTALRVIWSPTSDAADYMIEIAEGASPFTGTAADGDHEIQHLRLYLPSGQSGKKGVLRLLLVKDRAMHSAAN